MRALADASGLPVGIYAQGAGGSALAATLAAARAGAQVIACAIYPLALTLHRVSGEALAEALVGMGLDPGVDVDALWEATDLVDEHIGDELVTPLVPRIAVLAARADLPASVVGGIDHSLQSRRRRPARRGARGARPDPRGNGLAAARVADPARCSPRRRSSTSSRRAATSSSWTGADSVTGAFGTPPAPIDPRSSASSSSNSDPESEEDVTPPFDEVREQQAGSQRARRSCSCSASSEDAERLLRGIRGRGRREDRTAATDDRRAQRIREIVRIVQESGIGEVTIEEGDMRISVRSTPDLPVGATPSDEAPLAVPEPDVPATSAVSGSLVRVESPMVGTFFRAGEPGAPPFVEVGDGRPRADPLHPRGHEAHEDEVKADVEVARRACR